MGKKSIFLIAILLACALVATAGAAAVDLSVVWNKTYGKPGANDSAYAIVPVPGGGYLFSGDTESFGAGESDPWVVSLSGAGDEQWNRTYGEANWDTARSVINTSDGNFVFAGAFTYVTEGDQKDTDVRIVKINSTGAVLWDRTFGGPDVNASASAVAETSDGGYIVAGRIANWGEPDTDVLVIKFNRSGYEQWNLTFGEPGLNDSAYAVVEALSGEIGVAGSTESFNSFGSDAFVLKLSQSGDELWNVTFGGAENDVARSIILAPDGDFVFAGSYMNSTTSGRMEDDALVVKMKQDGKVVWNWTYGESAANESAYDIIATRDGGYIFAGRSGSSPHDNDAWVVKLDGRGAVEGELEFGGKNPGDRAASIIQTGASEYVVAGTFNTTKKGGTPETDAWVVKLNAREKKVTQPPAKPPKPPQVCPGQCPPPTPKPMPPPKPAPKTGCIGDYVWNDTNMDGIQNADEKGIKDVGVQLLSSDGKTVVKQTKTDTRGVYAFRDLQPGDYYARFDLPKGYVFTKKDAGGNDAIDSDADPTTGMTAKITLKAGDKQCQWDAGMVRMAGQIAVTKKTNGQDAKNPPGPKITVGDKVTWTYEVTNPGVGPLTNVTVTDDKAGPIAGPPAGDTNGDGKLDPGERWTYTKDDKAKDTSGLPGGSYNNTVTVTADDAGGRPVTAKDVSHYTSSPAGGGCACTANFTFSISQRAPPAGGQNADPLSLTIYHFRGSVQTSGCPAGTAPARWEWDFEDGKGWQDLGQNPTHTFAAAKTYDVKLRVTLSNGVTCEVTKKVTVEAPPQPEGKGSIGDFVWNDRNQNGKQDSGEKGLAGVVVTLLDENDNPINGKNGQPRRVTTKEDGKYVFDKLAEGKYKVEFDPPPGNWIHSPADNVPNDDNLDSDPGISGRTGIIVIKEGALVQSNWDAGFYNHAMQGTGQIGDLVWDDENENGIQDKTEKGIQGVSVTLMNDQFMQIHTTTTDANGKYLFTDLSAGDYYVVFGHTAAQGDAKFTKQDASANTKDDIDSDASMIGRTDKITLQNGQKQLNWDAGLIFTTRTTTSVTIPGQGSITGITFNDLNGNGILDEGESGVAGTGVALLTGGTPGESIPETGTRSSSSEREIGGRIYSGDGRSDGISLAVATDVGSLNVINKTTTDGRGAYAFTNLTIGEYYLMFDRPEGYTFAIPKEGNGFDPETGVAGPISIVENDTRITLNIGFNRASGSNVRPATANSTIGDLVWNDTDGNGIQDKGEGGIAGATVEVYYANATRANATTTDKDGAYLFTALPAGEYYLIFALPEGYNFTVANQGTDDARDSDADPATGRTASITLADNDTQLDWDAGANLAAAEAVKTAIISGFAWNDTNDNALQDEGEPGVPGVTVRLLNENDYPAMNAAGIAIENVTGEDGRYAFEGIVGKTYIVKVKAPEGFFFVLPNAGDDTRDSDVGVKTGRTEPFTLSGDGLTQDAGLTVTSPIVRISILGGFAWNDTNADGARDAGEAGVPGVAVALLNADGTIARTTTTDSTGVYRFSSVAVGTYSLKFTLPEGYTFSPSGKNSTADPVSGMTEQFRFGPGEEQTDWNVGLVPPTVEVTQTPTVEVTQTPTVEVTQTPTVEVTQTPEVEVTQTPKVEMTQTPTVEVTQTPTVERTPKGETGGGSIL